VCDEREWEALRVRLHVKWTMGKTGESEGNLIHTITYIHLRRNFGNAPAAGAPESEQRSDRVCVWSCIHTHIACM